MIANPCRGRFYIGPETPRRRKPGGYLRPKSRTYGPVGLRNAPAGAVESAPTQVSRVGNARRSRLMRYIRNDRRAGCPHPAAPRGAANTRGRDLRPKSRLCAAVGLRNAPTGAVNPSPTNRNKRRGQRENNKPCDITNPCRGRCLHRPGNPAPPQMPAGGISGLRAASARRLASETRLRAQ